MEIVGGIMLLLGWHNRVACGILMIFLLPTTFIVHAFWSFEGPEVTLQLSNFLQNLAIYGGLILLFCHGPGRWSIDTRRTCDQ
jgi:putative oxidoreductase